MEADNDGPPIEPVRKKTILKNETPEFVSTSVSNGKEIRVSMYCNSSSYVIVII